jgi:hypothetical protein
LSIPSRLNPARLSQSADHNAAFQSSAPSSCPPTTQSFYFVREHRLHGMVTGIQPVRLMASAEDGLDRLIVSFKDAKVCGVTLRFTFKLF